MSNTTQVTPVHARSQPGVLSLRQQNAIDLLVQGKTDKSVAETVGVCRETVTKWRRYHPDFIVALNKARLAVWSSSIDRLRTALAKSLDVILADLDDQQSETRVQSALVLLKLCPIPLEWLTSSGPRTKQDAILTEFSRRQKAEADRKGGMMSREFLLNPPGPTEEEMEEVESDMRRLAGGDDHDEDEAKPADPDDCSRCGDLLPDKGKQTPNLTTIPWSLNHA